MSAAICGAAFLFQSTLPLRGVTAEMRHFRPNNDSSKTSSRLIHILHQFPAAPNTSKCKDQTLSDYTFRLSNNNPELHQGSSFNFLRTKKVRTYL